MNLLNIHIPNQVQIFDVFVCVSLNLQYLLVKAQITTLSFKRRGSVVGEMALQQFNYYARYTGTDYQT